MLLLLPASFPSAGQALVPPLPLDTDGDTLPDLLERTAGLNPRKADVLSYVGGAGCSDRRPAAKVRSPKRPWCGLARAAAAAPEGTTVLVRAGVYDGLTAPRTAARTVRLRAYPGERVVLRGASISGGGLRLERFRITGTVNVLPGARRVALVGNRWITDGRSGGTNLQIGAGAQRVLVEGNTISQRGSGPGNAINFSSTDGKAPISGVTIRDNRIGPLRGGADAIQAKNTRSLVIEGNEIFGLSKPPGSGSHPDAIQTLYGAVNLVLRGNFIHDMAAQAVFVQDYRGANRGFLAEDNVIVRIAYPWKELAFAAEDARIIHNTTDGLLTVGGSSRRAVVVANVTGTLVYNPGAQVARDEFNMAARFAPRGRRSILGKPRFRNPARNDFRLKRGSRGWRKAPGKSDFGSRRANWSKRR